ncbi:MAG TPA: AAA family ATPase [Candidatus Desulfofervidus auxilii]|uniref:AAA family ATPase n=1 Tax=Desulfofervidus auxilii TaxID=1621989 RepID=A0A7C0U2M9_DESA2|nr:AAA family ATPase [Candidatus Desulfofervidus auxilii]
MYEAFYGLKENPFKLSPDMEYFFVTPKIKSLLDLLHYGLKQNVGFMMITGEVGVGKTSFLRYFLNQLNHNVERAYLFNPTFRSSEDLLSFFLLDLKVIDKIDPFASKSILLQKMYNYLLSQYEKGKKVLFIIDDAQAAPDFILEELRLISNFETNKDKLIQILLVGQPELRQKIESPSLRQLAQRIAIKAKMEPLNREETADYISYRLLKAGQTNLFDKKAIKLIHKASKGLPRLINLISERALIAGYVYTKPKIGKKEVKMALKDLEI